MYELGGEGGFSKWGGLSCKDFERHKESGAEARVTGGPTSRVTFGRSLTERN